uniref:RNA polymerase I subunit E n=1 Tax=Cynoglossus semilaevis TaxID=244447 RepID=A0A3P8UXQ4_CYNSE
MASYCSFVCSEEEKDAEKFSNGNVKDADKLDFTTYKSIEENNPRKKSRRIMVAESEKLSYVGMNFGAGSLKCNNLCKYYLGVLNRETMQMEVHNAQVFNMQPVIPGETDTASSQDAPLTYRDKVDSLIEAFGTTKQKRALSSRKLNQVGSDILQQAVAKAANTVIDQKGLEALQQEVAETESKEDLASHLPPCNPGANIPENVYLFDDLICPEDFNALEQAGSKMAALTPEELQKMTEERRCSSIVNHLEKLPSSDEARDKLARSAYYLSLLFHMAKQKIVSRKYCPRIIQNKLLRTFTVETFSNGSVVSASMKVKLAAYSLALLLHMGDMTADLTLLHRDLGITEARMIEIAKSMGLTVIKPARLKADETELQDEHKMASLRLPLVKYDQMIERRKRKKMR